MRTSSSGWARRRPVRAGLAAGVVVVALVAVPIPHPANAGVVRVAVDRAAERGLAETNKTWAARQVDSDGDGDQDVWIGYHQWAGKLWRNDGGTYTRVAPTAWPRVNPGGKVPDRHDCAFADVDLDGRVDAYCSAGRNLGNVVKYGMENELWLQLQPETFTNAAAAWGVTELCGRGRHVVFLNVNGDAYPDLYVGNATERSVGDPCDDPQNGLTSEASKVFVNDGGQRFVELSDSGVTTLGVGQRCVERIDLDRDGWDDLVGCRFNNQTPRLYRNLHGRFVDVTTANGLTTPLADIVVVDLDADGWDDVVTAATNGFGYRLNRGGQLGPTVSLGAPAVGQGRSVAVADADGDGDLDVYGLVADPSGNTNPDDVVFVNEGYGFSRLPVPSASGNGDEVVAVHPVVGGPAEFLVLNGADPAGPIQLIAVVETEPVPDPPLAVAAEPICAGLVCSFDGSGSSDPDGSVVAYDWDFGDGNNASGAQVDHEFAVDGTYLVRLTVTDDSGLSASTSSGITVRTPGTSIPVTFRGAAASDATGRAITVAVPPTVQPGDTLLLLVSSNEATPVLSAPAPWQRLAVLTDTSMQTAVFSRSADAATPPTVTVSGTAWSSLNAQVLAYSGTDGAPLAVGAVEPTWRSTHATPAVAVSAGDWVVSYWADKSGKVPNASWATPSSVTRRVQVVPASTTRRVTSVSADAVVPPALTSWGPVTATASTPGNLATMWSIRLRPAVP